MQLSMIPACAGLFTRTHTIRSPTLPLPSQFAVLPMPMLWLQVLWTFSIYLEAVAILPQLILLQRTQNIDNLTGNYVFLLG